MAAHDEQNEPHIILRTFGKCPKIFKFGDDFRAYMDRFNIYADMNNIPNNQRAPLLLTLLDDHSFNIASNLQLENFQNYDDNS